MVWIVDALPHEAGKAVGALMAQAMPIMKSTVEEQSRRADESAWIGGVADQHGKAPSYRGNGFPCL